MKNTDNTEQPTPPALASANGSTARSPEDVVRIELYNAAVAYTNYVSGDTSDYNDAMRVAQRLEEAADSFANR